MILVMFALAGVCFLGLLIGIALIGAAAVMFPPALLLPIGLCWYVFRPVPKGTIAKPLHHTVSDGYVGPHRARPPSPSAMDNPNWL